MKMRIFQEGGKCLFIVLLMVLIQSAAVNAEVLYSGNIRINKNENTISGKRIADTDIFIIDSRRELAPKQDSRSGIAVGGGEGYAGISDTDGYTIYTFLNLVDKPDVYILFKTGDEYAFATAKLPEPPAVGSVTINELAWYKLGVPLAPTITDPIDRGIETAKITGTCQGGYQYTDGNWLEIATRDDFSINNQLINFKVTRNSGLRDLLDVDNVDLNAPVFHHLVGKLSDGVVLQPDTTYYVRVRGAIPLEAEVSYGPWSEASSFNTAGAPPAAPTGTKTLDFKFNQTGINTFSIPLKMGTIVFAGAPAVINNVAGLIAFMNTRAGADVVRSFGWYDNDAQRHIGLIAIQNGVAATATGGAVAQINAMNIVPGKAYQVTVSQPVEFQLSGEFYSD